MYLTPSLDSSNPAVQLFESSFDLNIILYFTIFLNPLVLGIFIESMVLSAFSKLFKSILFIFDLN